MTFNPAFPIVSDVYQIVHDTEIIHNRQTHILKRLLNLSDEVRTLSLYGIRRHIYYCDKAQVAYSIDAFREIIDDAFQDKSIAMENETENEEAKKFDIQIGRNEIDRLLIMTEKKTARRASKMPLYS